MKSAGFMRWISTGCTIVALATPRAVLAEPEVEIAAASEEPEDTPRYRALITQAVMEMDAGHYPEARALFSEVHALAPNARTLRGLGIVAFELRDYVASVAYIEGALVSERRPLTDSQRVALEDVLKRAKSYVGTLSVDLEPQHGALWVDGTKREVHASIPLVVGDHEIEARAPGFLAAHRQVQITSGADASLRIALAPDVGPTSRGAAPTRDDVPARVWYKSPWLWAGAAVVVGAVVVGAVVATRDREARVADPILSPNTPSGGTLVALWGR